MGRRMGRGREVVREVVCGGGAEERYSIWQRRMGADYVVMKKKKYTRDQRTEMVMKIGRHMVDEEFEAAVEFHLGDGGSIYLDGLGQ